MIADSSKRYHSWSAAITPRRNHVLWLLPIWAALVVAQGAAMSDVLSRWFSWFFALPSDQQNFVLVTVPLLVAGIGVLVPPVRRWLRRVIIWHGSPVKVKANPYGIKHSSGEKHFIVFPDVTITNRSSDPETVNAELLLDEYSEEYDYRNVHTCLPETIPVPGWDGSQWTKRNELIRFPLNLDGRHAAHGYVAFCVWTMRGDVPESRNASEFRVVDLTLDKTVHRSKQSGPTMLLGSYRPVPELDSAQKLQRLLGNLPEVSVTDRAERARDAEARTIRRNDWLDLERRFRELRDHSIDAYYTRWTHDGVPDEPWCVGGENELQRKECEALCRLAGAMLLKSPGVIKASRIRASGDHAARWLYFLEEGGCISSTFKGTAVVKDETRTSETPLIENLPTASARMCLECSALET